MRSSFLTLLICGTALVIAACSANTEDTDSQQGESSQGGHAQHASMDMESGDPSESSLYHANSTWLDRNGNKLELQSMRGKVQVIAMAYTSCEYACPKIVGDMQEVEENLPGDVRNTTNFVLVSIDPERDTPQRLKEFASENNLSESNWNLLNGDRGDILELSALLGFRYQRISDTDYSHSNMITVLNKEGEIVHQRRQMAESQSDIIAKIQQAAD